MRSLTRWFNHFLGYDLSISIYILLTVISGLFIVYSNYLTNHCPDKINGYIIMLIAVYAFGIFGVGAAVTAARHRWHPDKD